MGRSVDLDGLRSLFRENRPAVLKLKIIERFFCNLFVTFIPSIVIVPLLSRHQMIRTDSVSLYSNDSGLKFALNDISFAG